MPSLIIEEFVQRQSIRTYEFAVTDFTGATVRLMRYLWRNSTSTYAASVMLKWTGGPYTVGAEQPFDIREFGDRVGSWTEFRYRLENPKVA